MDLGLRDIVGVQGLGILILTSGVRDSGLRDSEVFALVFGLPGQSGNFSEQQKHYALDPEPCSNHSDP